MSENKVQAEAGTNANYCKVPIKYLLQFSDDFLQVEVFIKLGNEKYIKVTLKESGFTETVENYMKKGLTDVYLLENDFKSIFTAIKERMSHKQFYNPETVQEKKIMSLDATYNIAKEFIVKLGFDEGVADVLKAVNVQSLKVLKQSKNIFAFFKDFKDKCDEEFLKNVMINHLVIMMIDKFSWRSMAIKEKATLASMLCDIGMNKEDFKTLEDCLENGTPIPEEIRKHPLRISEILKEKKEAISAETVTMIEQHHERPDGKGFPHGYSHQRINQLSAIYITASYFMDQLIKSNFNYSAKDDILDDTFTLMQGGVFDKAFDALKQVVSED